MVLLRRIQPRATAWLALARTASAYGATAPMASPQCTATEPRMGSGAIPSAQMIVASSVRTMAAATAWLALATVAAVFMALVKRVMRDIFRGTSRSPAIFSSLALLTVRSILILPAWNKFSLAL